jgi:hypothetical protein
MDRLRLNQFPSVGASAQSVLITDELLDKSVHAIGLKLGGGAFTRAHISAFNIRINGKDLLPAITGAQLQAQNDYNGLDNDAAYMWFFFGDPTAQTIKGQHLGDLDLSIYRKPLEIRVDIGAATTPTLEVVAMVSVPKLAMGIGYSELEAAQIGAMTRTIIQPAAAVNRKTYGLSLGSLPGARIRSVNYHHTNLTAVELRKQGLTKFDNLTIAENSAFVKNYSRVPQSGLFVLDNVFDGNQGEAETSVNSEGRPWNMEFMLTTSALDTIAAYTSLHASLPQL